MRRLRARVDIRWGQVCLAVLGGLVAIYLCTAESAKPPLTISIDPRVFFAGATLTITCRVRSDPANRWLDMGVFDYRQSGQNLDGEDAPLTHRFEVPHVPCGTSEAFCRLNGSILVTQPFEVAGCQ